MLLIKSEPGFKSRKRWVVQSRESGRIDYDSDDSSSWGLDEEDEDEKVGKPASATASTSVEASTSGEGSAQKDKSAADSGIVPSTIELVRNKVEEQAVAEITTDSPRQMPLMWCDPAPKPTGHRFSRPS